METIKITISLDIEVEVVGRFEKGTPGCFYKSNGDPGDPPEPDSFEIEKIEWHGIDIAPMLNEEGYDFSSIEEQCVEKIVNNNSFEDYDW